MSDQRDWPGSGAGGEGKSPSDGGQDYQAGESGRGPGTGSYGSQWPPPAPQQQYQAHPYAHPAGPGAYGGHAYPPYPYAGSPYGPPPPGGQPPVYGSLPPAAIPPSPEGPRRGSRAMRAGAAALVLVGAVVAGAGIGRAIWPGSTSPQASGPSQTTVPGSDGSGSSGLSPFAGSGASGTTPGSEGPGGPSDVSAIAAKVSPALVDINDVFNYEDAEGAGTGIVLTSDGEILTNNHVIDGETKLSVTDVGNGQTYSATVVGYDNTHDVAVLQLQGASGLKTATIASSAPSVGEAVVAIGNAGGAGGTPTSAGGSVTALNRSINAQDELTGSSEQLSGLIETNANVESGDSGGALVNASGKVIGMDTAASQGFDFSSSGNQGFAIPISKAVQIAKEIKAGKGSSTVHVGATAFLGVKVNAQEASNSPGLGYGYGTGGTGGTGGYAYATATGAQICNTPECVVSGAPAAQAGLRPGDVITSLGGKTVTSASALTHLLVPYHPGQKVKVVWVDASGSSHQSTLTLGSGPPS